MNRQSDESDDQYQAEESYTLTIKQIVIHDSRMKGQSYAKLINLQETDAWYESQIFHMKSTKIWELEVKGNHLEIQIYTQAKNKYQFIGVQTLKPHANQVAYYLKDQPHRPIWTIKYDFVKASQKNQKNNNHFNEPSMIFKDLAQISAIQHRDEINNITMQKMGYTLKEQSEEPQDQQQLKSGRELFQQLKSLDKSILKSFREYSMEHKLCSQLVEQSNSQEVEANQKQVNSAIQEENDDQIYETTQEKWFKNKFKGKYPTKEMIKRRRLTSISKPQNPPKVITKYFPINDQPDEDGHRIISEFIINQGPCPQNISVFVMNPNHQETKIAELSTEPQNIKLKSWETNIQAPLNGPIMIETFQGNKKLSGCIGYDQQIIGQCSLFNENGQIKGSIGFKCKKTENINIQTQQMLDQMGEEQMLRQSENSKKNEAADQDMDQIQGSQASPKKKMSFRKNRYESEEKKDNSESKQPADKVDQKSYNEFRLQLNTSDIKVEPIPQNVWLPASQNNNPKNNDYKGKIKKNFVPITLKAMNPQNSVPAQPVTSNQNTRIPTDIEDQDFILPRTRTLSISKLQKNNKKQLKRQYTEIKSTYKSHTEEENPHLIEESNVRKIELRSNPQQNQSESYRYEQNSPDNRFEEEDSGVSKQYNQFLPPHYRNQVPVSNRMFSYQNSIAYDDRDHILAKNHILNFKIESVAIQLNKPLVQGKILKFWIDGCQPYVTQTCKQINFPFWKGKGYFFEKVSEFSMLHLQLYSISNEASKCEGKCTIYLAILPRNEKRNQVFSQNVREYIKNRDSQVLGDVVLTYSFIEKGSRSLSIMQRRRRSNARTLGHDQVQLDSNSYRNNSGNLKTKRKKIHLKTENNRDLLFDSKSMRNSLASKISRINFDGSSSNNFLRGPLSPKRKYKGGNIIIPRAKRQLLLRSPQQPGPGSYEVSSCFDIHKIQD